jgi:hypothetical protein
MKTRISLSVGSPGWRPLSVEPRPMTSDAFSAFTQSVDFVGADLPPR